MADQKITELTETTTVDDDDVFVVVDAAATTKKITGANLKSAMPSGGTAEDVVFTPAGNLAADDVQEALEELDSEKAAVATTLTAGNGLSGGGDLSVNRSFAVNVDDSTIEINSDTLRVKAGGITASHVASDVATQAELDAHIGDTADAHDASAISLADSGGNTSETDVEGAIAELYGMVGGGGGAPSPDDPPGSPGDLDDEFDDSNFSGWTWRNQGGMTATEGANQVLLLNHPGTGWRGIEKTVSGAFSVIAKMSMVNLQTDFTEFGLYAANNGSGKLCGFEMAEGASIPMRKQLVRLDNFSTFNSAVTQETLYVAPLYHKLVSDGTDLLYYVSWDGVAWGRPLTEALATFISSVDRVGVYCQNSHGTALDLSVHWFRGTS